MGRFARFFEGVMQALLASREREAGRVIRRYEHFVAQAEEYERHRAMTSATTKADAKTIAGAKSVMARGRTG